ncbi:MAG TPA: class I SAM-dependent methyltransferase [Desulfobacteria bacterium]|nr:class I SAM-dependent methyltransferase [Desulfobacteria bacterium]
MTANVLGALQKDRLRERFTKYTRQAFQMLPELEDPDILDIGCGTGLPTMELARLSNGQIIGLDICQPDLDELHRKIEAADLSDRVKPVNSSLFEMDFPDESFDIVWAEGSLFIIGFEQGLKAWRRLLKPWGFLVVHDEPGNLQKKLELISRCGYALIGQFTVSEDSWWREYYEPLEKRIKELRVKYGDDSGARKVLDKEQQEVEMFKRDPRGSVFLVMQKR